MDDIATDTSTNCSPALEAAILTSVSQSKPQDARFVPLLGKTASRLVFRQVANLAVAEFKDKIRQHICMSVWDLVT